MCNYSLFFCTLVAITYFHQYILTFQLLCRLFEKGLSFVGRDYSSHVLWDKYIEFEYSQKQWSHLAYIYISTLKFPTKRLNDYYIRYVVEILFIIFCVYTHFLCPLFGQSPHSLTMPIKCDN